MSKFLFAYRAAKNYTAASTDVMAAWNAWFTDLGASVVDVGNPVFDRSAVGNCATDTVLGGYSLITADDLDAAVALAKGCPAIESGGGVEVGELTLLNVESVATNVADHARATQLAS
jgi:hypothetical protein